MSEHERGCSCEVCARFMNAATMPNMYEADLSTSQRLELESVKRLRPQWLTEANELGFTTHTGHRRMCYRSVDSRSHHLAIYAYSVGLDGIRLTAWHGKDSTSPGVGRVNTEPAWLIPCGCGQWEEASAEQTDETRRRVAGRVAADIAKQKRRALFKKRRD